MALTFVYVERDGADGDADHAFWVVEKLNGFGVQGKVISVLCVGDREEAPVSKASHRQIQAAGGKGTKQVNRNTGQYCVLLTSSKCKYPNSNLCYKNVLKTS